MLARLVSSSSSDLLTWASQSAGITEMSHHTRPSAAFLEQAVNLWQHRLGLSFSVVSRSEQKVKPLNKHKAIKKKPEKC